jgi:hypothetical protein
VTRRYYLIVDATVTPGGQTAFTLATSTGTVVTDGGVDGGTDGGTFVDAGTPAGESCLQPEPLIIGTPVIVALGFSTNDTSATSGSCNFGNGPDRMYAVTIPAGQRLTVSASPQGPFDLTLSAAANAVACAMGLCSQSVQSTGPGGTETLLLDNPGMTVVSTVIILDSLTPMSGQVGLFASLTPLASLQGDTCQAPIVVMPPQTLVGLSTQGLIKDYTLSGLPCRGPMGAEAVFQVTVGPSQTLGVVVSSMSDAVINVLAGPASTCGLSGCLAGVDQTGSGVETLSWTNGPAAQTVFVTVGRFGAAPPTMQYDVSFSLSP